MVNLFWNNVGKQEPVTLPKFHDFSKISFVLKDGVKSSLIK